jgi:heptosyltransferase-1
MNHENWVDLIDKTTVHQIAALMQKSSLLISPPSGLVHLASHCELKTLTIVGGSEPGEATQYPNSEFIDNRPSCKDCFFGPPCEHDYLCMREISVESVLSKTLVMLTDERK